MSNLAVSTVFTKSIGQPATGLTLTEINLYLTRQHRVTGAVEIVWDGTQHPTVEVTNTGIYGRMYADADLATYNYYVRADYTGAEVLDTDYAMGALEEIDILEKEVPDGYASGTAGHALGRIGSGQIVVTSPVAQDGDVEIVRGDDYVATDGRALEWTDTEGLWPALTGATIGLTVPQIGLTKAGSVVTPTGEEKKVRVELTAANTAGVDPGNYPFDVQATLAVSGRKITLVRGEMVILRDYTT